MKVEIRLGEFMHPSEPLTVVEVHRERLVPVLVVNNYKKKKAS